MSETGAAIIRDAFLEYQEAFRAVTRRARTRFETCDWRGAHADAVERLELYGRTLQRALKELREVAGGALQDRRRWPSLKHAYAGLVAGRNDLELAETFFNSLTRRLFATQGIEPTIEFVDSPAPARAPATPLAYERHAAEDGLDRLVEKLLRRPPLQAPWWGLEADARAVAERIRAACPWPGGVEAADIVPALFFRGKGAYLVGRLLGRRGRQLPMVLALLNDARGVTIDAVLLDDDAASIVFGFTRSYFFVESGCPAALVEFLQAILPHKRRAELYIALGYNKHGKTELFRDLRRQLHESELGFEIAPGERGMVMAVFALPSLELVFKVIRDRFAEPKAITREGVLEKYALVFRHDRAGRLIDAQEFEHLRFPRRRFSEAVLEELTRSAADSVSLGPEHVDIKHLYVERRLTPLNLYLRDASPGEARRAVIDYGQAIRDLAATNIFPGDVLLKNFGLTRHGRVVFYDYDELALVTDCVFRALPEPRDDEQEWAAEPWFHVGQNDIFPEEFVRFLGLPPPLHAAFLQAHGELLTAGYWQRLRERLLAGEIVDIYPYRPEHRLPHP